MSLDDVFLPYNSDEGYAVRSHKAFEERVVLRIIDQFGLRDSLAKLRANCREVTDSDKLSFWWFRAVYPSFPVWISSRRIKNRDFLWTDMFMRATNTSFFQELQEVRDELPEYARDSHYGLVFEYPEVGLMIIHTAPPRVDLDRDGGFLTRVMKKHGYITIEPFVTFLSSLEWAP